MTEVVREPGENPGPSPGNLCRYFIRRKVLLPEGITVGKN